VSDPQTARNVSFAPGETTYREFFYRHTYRDGTVMDTPPRKVGDSAPGTVAGGIVAGLRNVMGASAVRMERTVTVSVTDWAEVTPQPLVDEAKLAESVTPQTGDPNDYCQRQLCGHARGFHVKGTPDTGGGEHDGPCGRCDATSKCAYFVAKSGPGKRMLVESAKRGEVLVTCSDRRVRRMTSFDARNQTHDFAGPAAADLPSEAVVTLRSGEWVRVDG